MEYQKIANLIDGASSQPSKFRTKNWVEKNITLWLLSSKCKIKRLQCYD